MRRTAFRLTQLETRDTPATGFTAAGAAAGGLPLVAVLRPDGSTLAQFSAFEDAFRGGVRAAAGELDGDPNTQEVVAAAGPGGGPAVKVFSVDVRTGAVTPRSAFFAFEPTFTGGVRVTAGNVAGRADGVQQIVVGAGEGGGPRVRTVDINGNQASGALGDFFAYEPSFRGGVQVAAGELDGNLQDGAELAVAAGTGGGPRVRVLRSDGATLADYFAFDSNFRGGANVTIVNTGGAVGTIVPDAFALDPSQRNTALTTAAFAPFQSNTTNSSFGSTTGVNGLGTVNTLGGGGITNVGGGVTNIGGGVTGLNGSTGLSGTTFQTGISSTTGGVGGIGTSATGTGGITGVVNAGDLSAATGVSGVGSNAINNLGVSAPTTANGITSNVINNAGITGATTASGLTGNVINNPGITGATGFDNGLAGTGVSTTGFNTGLNGGTGFTTTGVSGFNTGLAGTGFTTSGVNGATVGNGLSSTVVPGTTLSNGLFGTGFNNGLTTTTGTTGFGTGTTGFALTVPQATAFGPFGNPGTAITTPVLANPPFAQGLTRYVISV